MLLLSYSEYVIIFKNHLFSFAILNYNIAFIFNNPKRDKIKFNCHASWLVSDVDILNFSFESYEYQADKSKLIFIKML
jgi:hypothetical protein